MDCTHSNEDDPRDLDECIDQYAFPLLNAYFFSALPQLRFIYERDLTHPQVPLYTQLDVKDKMDLQEVERTIIQLVKEVNPQSVDKLAELAAKELSLPKDRVLNFILDLHSAGVLTLEDPAVAHPEKLRSYLASGGALWFWLTLAFSLATSVLVFWVSEDMYPWIIARYVAGAAFILWFPGYSFVKALFPRKVGSKDIDSLERVALSFGMSLALVPVVGLLLNYTPWGIRLIPVTLSLLALTIIFAVAGVIREYSEVPK